MEFKVTNQWLGQNHYGTVNHGGKGTINITIALTLEQLAAINGRQLNVTIEPVKSREERLREARLREFDRVAEASERIPSVFSATEAVNIIERVDAEFAKETP